MKQTRPIRLKKTGRAADRLYRVNRTTIQCTAINIAMERRSQDRLTVDAPLLVFDRQTDQPIGQLVNLSPKGAMLVTIKPVKEGTSLKCRLDLATPIRDCHEFLFDADCLWCRRNVSEDRWESGYRLTVTGRDAELIQYLLLSLKLAEVELEDLPNVGWLEIENRRESARHSFKSVLAVFEPKNYRQIGELADLSIRGARIVMDDPPHQGDRVGLRIQLPKPVFHHEYLIFDAECRWCRKRKDSENFDVGFRIVNIAASESPILSYLLIHYGVPMENKRQTRVTQ